MSRVVEFKPREVRDPDMGRVCRDYLTHLTRRRYSPATLYAYKLDLEQLAGWCARHGVHSPLRITGALLDRWVDALLTGEEISPRSAQRKLSSVRAWLAWCVKRGIVPVNAAEDATPVRVHNRRVIAPAGAEILRLIESIPDDNPGGIRDRALFRLMYDTALRIGGAISLDIYDPANPPACCVHPNGLVTYRAKGGVIKDTIASDETLAWLDKWLCVRWRFRREHSAGALFLSNRGTRMSRHLAHERIKHWGALAGMPDMHCHLLRHRRLGNVYEAAGIHAAHYMSGHANRSTTVDIYGHERVGRMRALAATVPLTEDGGGERDEKQL